MTLIGFSFRTFCLKAERDGDTREGGLRNEALE